MSGCSASRPPGEQSTHSRSRSASIFNAFSSRNPSSPTKSNGSPRKPSTYRSPTKEMQGQQRDMEAAGNNAEGIQVLQDCHNRGAPSPRKAQDKETTTKHQKSPSKIANIFSRSSSRPPRSSDKENTAPSVATPSPPVVESRPPIWAQFATHQPALRDAAPESTGRSRETDSTQESQNGPFSTGQAQSRVKAAVAMYNQKITSGTSRSQASSLNGEELNNAFEAVLVSRNIPENMKEGMRGLDEKIKRDFVKNNTSSAAEATSPEKEESKPSSLWGRARAKSSTRGRDRKAAEQATPTTSDSPSKRARSRSRGRVFSIGRGDKDSTKSQRSSSRTKSIMSLKNLSSSSVNSLSGSSLKSPSVSAASGSEPDEYVAYLKADHKLEDILVGKIANLRRLVRNEAVAWTDDFIVQGGMSALIELLMRIMRVEWREEHEDALLHEVLRTLKGLSTTQRALANLALMAPSLFPSLLHMLFDEEKKGPSEFSTREIIMWLLFQHLATALPEERTLRAKEILGYVSDPSPPEDEQQLGFIAGMRQRRPYLVWCKEVDNVTKEVFWIFLHHMNTVPVPDQDGSLSQSNTYYDQHFPKQRAPVPSAPYVGGVEWDATNYVASHLDLINGLLASLTTRQERNQLRQELRDSNFEKLMGGTLRICKEKFYGNIHDGLRTWVTAAAADGWDVNDVAAGPAKASPSKSPAKSAGPKEVNPPKLQLPKFDLDESEKLPRRDDNDMWI